jgi:hypothetical protein
LPLSHQLEHSGFDSIKLQGTHNQIHVFPCEFAMFAVITLASAAPKASTIF